MITTTEAIVAQPEQATKSALFTWQASDVAHVPKQAAKRVASFESSSGVTSRPVNPASESWNLSFFQNILQLAGAFFYLGLPFLAMLPWMSVIVGAPVLKSDEVTALWGTAAAIAPVGLVYMYALAAPHPSLTAFTIFTRLLWAVPFIALGLSLGLIEPHIGALILSVDVPLPVAMIAMDPAGFFRSLSLGKAPSNLCDYLAHVEALVGIAISAGCAVLYPGGRLGFDFMALWAAGIYSCFLLWSVRSGVDEAGWACRAALLAILATLSTLGWAPGPLAALAFVSIMGTYAQVYTRCWARVSNRLYWILGVSALYSFSGVAWPASAILIGRPLTTPLLFNVIRADLIFGCGFSLLAPLLDDIPRASATFVSWILPFAAIWGGFNTKFLILLDGGTPLHPSWISRGISPKWSGSTANDVNVTLSILCLTIVATVFTAVNVLIYVKRPTAWHGTLMILVSCMYMIARSSGVPSLSENIPFPPEIPPIYPIEEKAAVGVHVGDLLLGIILLFLDVVIHRFGVKLPTTFVYFIVVGAWAVSCVRKLIAPLRV